MMQLRRSFLVMTVSALLAACGGGGGDSSNDSAQPENNLGSQPTETTTIVSAGQFVDAPVVGLHYQTETQSGETDQYGRFSFIKGETVSFYIGDQLLGSAIAKNTVTPLDLVPESKRFVDSLEVSNILRLLQTLDVDTTDDVIELTAATHQAFIGTSYDLTLPFDSALEQQLAQVTIQQPNGAQQLVSAADAQAHFVETLQQFTVKPEYDFDTDGDGIGNKQDPDDDNDGIADEDDTTPQGGIDTDLDGIENDIDDDDDNDGVLDINDVFPLDKDESADTDSDGIGNNADADDDNDGVEDSADAFPLNYAESVDTDGDGIGNTADIDDDNDGVVDVDDDLPLNKDETIDTDGDGVGNTADTDDDNDGVADVEDIFPFDQSESVDSDGDGIGNNADMDDDNDGVADVEDVFPFDKSESVDTDGDGIGNNADTDDDNDGVIDTEDELPLNKDETVDSDGDGIGNNADTDDDNDGVSDAEDEFPLDKNESVDTDGDGIGNNADADDDNDGVADAEDIFPLDQSENADADADGIGNNADIDDDNDGVADVKDAFPFDKNESVDTDGDGIGNNADTDDDNDGLLDKEEAEYQLSSVDALDAWQDADLDGFSNLYEIYARTNPHDASIKPALQDWQMLQGNAAHNGYIPLLLSSADFKLDWEMELNAELSDMIISGDQLFIASGNSLVGINASTGTLFWNVDLPIAQQSAPSYANGLVYIVSNDVLSAFEVQTGHRIFQTRYNGSEPSTLYGDMLYASGGATGTPLEVGLTVFDIKSGVVNWIKGGLLNSRFAVAVDQTFVYTIYENALRIYDRLDGSNQLKITGFPDHSVAGITQQSLVLGRNQNIFLRSEQRLFSVDTVNASLQWITNESVIDTGVLPAVGNGLVFSRRQDTLFIFDEVTGEKIWSWEAPEILTSNIALTVNYVFVSSDVRTYALDLRTQKLAWSYPIGGSKLSLGMDGHLFINTGTAIHAIKLGGDLDYDGMLDVWEINLGGNLQPSEDLDFDGLDNVDEFKYRTNAKSSDTDNDGLSDLDEINIFYSDPLLLDSDGDGLSDSEEVLKYKSDPLNSDTDGDQLNDSIEVAYGLNPTDGVDAQSDTDNDGLINIDEIRNGTDPFDPASKLYANDWLMPYGNAQHSGFNPVALNIDNFQELLSCNSSDCYSWFDSIVLAQGVVVFVRKISDVQFQAEARDVLTGEVKWTTTLGPYEKISELVLYEEKLYFLSIDVEHQIWVNALDFYSGEPLLSIPTDIVEIAASKTTLPYHYVSYSNIIDNLVIEDGKLFSTFYIADTMKVDVYTGFFAIDIASLNSLFVTVNGSFGMSEMLSVFNGSVYAIPASSNKMYQNLYILDALNGQVQKHVSDIQVASQTPVITNTGSVIVVNNGELIHLSDAGERLWQLGSGCESLGQPAVGQGVVAVVCDNQALLIVDLLTGKEKLRWQIPHYASDYNIIVTLTHVIVSAGSQMTHFIDLNTLQEVMSYPNGGPIAVDSLGRVVIGHRLSVLSF